MLKEKGDLFTMSRQLHTQAAHNQTCPQPDASILIFCQMKILVKIHLEVGIL